MLIEELTEEQKDAMLAEVGYTRRQLDSDLEHIKDWLKLQHHLPPSRLTESDYFLINYLTGCKGSLEKVKRKLDAYYTLRSHSEIFDCRDPLDPEYLIMVNALMLAISPNVTKGKTPSRVLVVAGFPNADRQNMNFSCYMRRYLHTIELWLRESSHWVKFCVLLDAREVEANDLSHSLIRDLLRYLLQAMPLRYTKLYVINTPSYLAPLINNMIIPFVPKKHKQKLYITTKGFEEVSQYFDKSVLPSDYGGDLPPLKELYEIWRAEEIKRRDWFVNELSERCDESKRIIPQDPTNPYFGMPGSLKKLVVD
uniref:Putative phosphatidylinositol transfer protein sec14 n=1 Tax=Panstrongylus lignarius TaxID=156445 RepID=A0A224XTY5_9HEMI